MIVKADTPEFKIAKHKVWMDIHNNYPYIVKTNMSYDQYCEARIWLAEKNISFIQQANKKYNLSKNYDVDVRWRFQTKNDAMLFRLKVA